MDVFNLEIRFLSIKKGDLVYIVKIFDKKRIGYYYCINDLFMEVNEAEYIKVNSNPYLYYFSTALKLYLSLRKINGHEISEVI